MKNDPWFIRITSFFKISYETIRKNVGVKIKFVKCIIFLYSNFFSLKIITFLSNDPFNNNIAILDSKIMYFYLKTNFRGWTSLTENSFWKNVFFLLVGHKVDFIDPRETKKSIFWPLSRKKTCATRQKHQFFF